MLNMMSLEPDKVVTDNWNELAKEFSKAFTARYMSESITPYMHVFIYHVGYYLQNVGSIEAFANYDIEAWHKKNKRVKSGATNFLGGPNGTKKKRNPNTSFTFQQLAHHRRTVNSPLPKTLFGEWTKAHLDKRTAESNQMFKNILEAVINNRELYNNNDAINTESDSNFEQTETRSEPFAPELQDLICNNNKANNNNNMEITNYLSNFQDQISLVLIDCLPL
jgi:hypothetical protein